ncbi:MAG: alpha/beta hydrolase [Hellea sp.]|nr:alpha/beta hydrolase [Hellea sp.]
MRKIVWGILILALLYLIGMLIIFLIQRKFYYLPPDETGTPIAPPIGMAQVTNTSSLGHDVMAWWAPPADGGDVVVYFHGNGSAVIQGGFLYQDMMMAGLGVLAAEYPGYPRSSGTPSEANIIAAAEAHYEFLISQGIRSENIHLYGTSLGAGVAAQLASRKQVGSLILEAPFYSMVDMIKLRLPIYGFRPLVRDKYESYRALESVDVPLLWIHGTVDQVIPIEEGRRLYDGYTGPKSQYVISGGTHQNLWISGGRERIIAFLTDVRP